MLIRILAVFLVVYGVSPAHSPIFEIITFMERIVAHTHLAGRRGRRQAKGYCILKFRLIQLHWLYWAYYLEMKGANTFLHLWMAGLLFFCVNVYILVTFIQKQRLRATFQDGKINSVGISDKVD